MALNTTIRDCIKILSQGQELTGDQISKCISEIMKGEASPSQIGAFLVFLQSRPLSSDILLHSAKSVLSLALPFEWNEESVDIVGTGGDALSTFNASTAASFVAAAAGITVTKQGNRSSSGKCGSADFLEALGVKLDLTSEQLIPLVKRHNYAFLWAQTFHPSFKSVAPIRKELGIRTIFNVLGPIVNPSNPSHMIAGVGVKELGPLYAEVLSKQGKRAMVVHSLDGLDEITPSSDIQVWHVENGNIREEILTPEDFGVVRHPIEFIAGSTPDENVHLFRRVLSSIPESETDPKVAAVLDFISMNVAAAAYITGRVNNLKEGTILAKHTIWSGKAIELVDNYIASSNQFNK